MDDGACKGYKLSTMQSTDQPSQDRMNTNQQKKFKKKGERTIYPNIFNDTPLCNWLDKQKKKEKWFHKRREMIDIDLSMY